MKTVINIKTEKELKKDAQKLAKNLGFSLSAVINAYLRQFVRSREVYFSDAPRMSQELEKLLGRVEFDIQRGWGVSRSFSSREEIKKHLNSL